MEHSFDKEFRICSNDGHALRGRHFIKVYITKTLKIFSRQKIGQKLFSIVELDPQSLLTVGTYIVKKRCIHYGGR